MLFYNLQTVPVKNKLKYKCSIFGRGKSLICKELQTMPMLVIRIRLYSLHKNCIPKINTETACTLYSVQYTMYIVKSIIKHNKHKTLRISYHRL